MREIKFSYMYQHEETGTWTNAKYTLEEIEREKRSVNNFARHTLVARRQYTGLKDSKGVDIYEGDIVTGKKRGDPIKGHLVVYDIHWFVHDPHTLIYLGSVGDLEVVGNIYENPESIEQGG